MKSKRLAHWLLVFITILLMSACNMPTGSSEGTPDLNGTVAAQVAIAQAAQTMVAQTLGAGGSVALPTNTNANGAAAPQDTLTPTSTPTITLTPTITQTATPEGVFLILSNDTYCRKGGPFSSFPVVVTVKAGVNVEVLSRNPENDSYFVKNPYDANSKCWLYGKYATLGGNSASLPVSTMQATPTPTPTPTPDTNFSVSYVSLENCMPHYAFKLFVKNIGGSIWQSIQITGSDSVTGFVINHSNNSFLEYSGCSMGVSQSDLTPGESSYVLNINPGQFNYDPTGHLISINVKLCSQDNTLGVCISKALSFTP